MEVTEEGIMREPVKPEQSRNTALLIEVRDGGSTREPVKPEQPRNALLPIEVTEEDIMREPLKPEHPENAPPPIEVTEVGIMREPIKPEQPRNALSPMVVIVGERVISPEQQAEEGVFLLIQFSVIPSADGEVMMRMRRQMELMTVRSLFPWSLESLEDSPS